MHYCNSLRFVGCDEKWWNGVLFRLEFVQPFNFSYEDARHIEFLVRHIACPTLDLRWAPNALEYGASVESLASVVDEIGMY